VEPLAPDSHGGSRVRRPLDPSPRAITPPDVAPPRSAEPPSPSAQLEAPAYVTVDTYPWSRVTLDGRGIGNTPVVALQIKPGAHTLVFETESGHRHVQSMVLAPGERWSKRLAFE
jgi:eukaryotic-like serine/threonine-protein kinase